MTDLVPTYAEGFAPADGRPANPGLWEGLIGAWCPHLGPTGHTLYDHSVHHRHGLLDASMTGSDWAPTTHGWGLTFDGVDGEVVAGVQPGLSPARLTVAVWTRQTASHNYDAWGGIYRTSDNERSWLLGANNSADPIFGVSSNGVNYEFRELTSPLTTNRWHLLLCMYDGVDASTADGLQIYVDGIRQSTVVGYNSGTPTGPLYQSPTVGMVIGATTNHETNGVIEPFDGTIAGFYMWDRVLTPSEILRLYDDPYALTRLAPRRIWQAAAAASDDLTGDSTTHGHTVDAANIGQDHVLAGGSTTHGHTVDDVPLGQVHVLTTDATTHGHTVDSAALGQKHALSVDTTTHEHTTGTATLEQIHVLVTDSTAHPHTVDPPLLGQAHVLTSDDTAHLHTVDAPTSGQAHVLQPSDTTHGHTAAGSVLGQVHALTAGGAVHTHTVGAAAFEQIHVLVADGATHLHTVDAPTLGQTQHALSANGTTHAHVTSEPTLAETHVLSTDSTTHTHTVGGVPLGQVHTLVANNTTHIHTVTESAPGQVHSLIAGGATHAHTVAEPTLGQTQHALVASSTTSIHTVDVSVLGHIHVLTAGTTTHVHTVAEPLLGAPLVTDGSQIIAFRQIFS